MVLTPALTVEQQFLEAYEKLAPVLRRHAYYRVMDTELANDLVSETFTRAWDKYRLEPVQNLRALLYQVLHNLIVDYYRSKQETVSLEQGDAEGEALQIKDPKSLEQIYSAAQHDEIAQALKFLPSDYRTALVGKYIDDLSVSEIAKLVGKSRNATYVVLYRALKKLRQVYNS